MTEVKGSSPIGHPKKRLQRLEKIEVQNSEVRHTVEHLLSDYAPGGEQNLTEKMRAQLVKLHTTGNRWYVSYYSETPAGEKKRHKAYGFVNTEKDLKKRMQLLLELQAKIFNSIHNNSFHVERRTDNNLTIFKIVTLMLTDKKEYLKEDAYRSIRIKLQPFKNWLLESNNEWKHPTEITKIDILNYRNWLLLGNRSNRTVNNYIDEVSALFSYAEKIEIVFRNPCKQINSLPSRSETHVAYTEEEALLISEYLQKKDKTLLFYIQLVSYTFLRTKEARTLQIKHIDFTNMRILLTAQNNKVNRRTWKVIPEIFKQDFLNKKLHEQPKDYFIFGKNGNPGPVNICTTFFTKRFRKVKKAFGLSTKHTLYGFRHTAVSQLLRNGKKWDDIMKLTGHTQYSTFQKYARSVGADEPKDLSDGFSIKI